MSQNYRHSRSRSRNSSRSEARGYSLVETESAIRFLQKAFSAYSFPNDEAAYLAGLYHQGILSLVAAERERSPAPGRAAGFLGSFLALAKLRPGEGYLAALRRFAYAAPQIGTCPNSPSPDTLEKRYGEVLYAVAQQALSEFKEGRPEADTSSFLHFNPFPAEQLLEHPLGFIYSVIYVPKAIRSSLEVLVALNPKDEYPEARAMKRHFILHIGGTNTGKTYAGFLRLMQADTGVYLSPLRLLALEAQETLLDAHVRCSLSTGEEEDRKESDTHVAATCEKLDLHRHWDVAVIDECQMIADRERGYAWTRAILGVLAPEIHLCAAPEAEGLLLWMISACGDTYEVVRHQRMAPLYCMKHCTDYSDLQPGDALITFSKVGVLSIAEDLRSRGMKPAIIYGALPYSARRMQMEGFLNGDMRYVVATDAIGMGLNLPIRRVIFMETSKYDGHEVRELTPAEVKQIAGRAGRYGIYDKGYVGAAEDLPFIKNALETAVPPLEEAIVGFSELVLQVDFDLLEVLKEWNAMPTPRPYVKLDISRYISVITALREDGFHLSREQELRVANIPYDETDADLKKLFNSFLRTWLNGEAPSRPVLPERNAGGYTLPELESHCKELDLYFSFSKAFEFDVDLDDLRAERERTAEEINEILLYNLKNNIRFCAACGSSLPLHYRGRLCPACSRRTAYNSHKRGHR